MTEGQPAISPARTVNGDPEAAMVPDTAYLVAARVLTAAAGWAGSLIIIRSLSTTAWGAYSLVFGIQGIIGILCDLQVSRVVMGEMGGSAEEAGRRLGSFVMFRSVFGVAGYAAGIVAVMVGGYPGQVVWTMVDSGPALVLGAVAGALVVGFSARMRLRPTGTGTVLGQVVQLGLIVLLALARQHSAALFATTNVVCFVVICAYLWVVATRLLPVRLELDPKRWGAWLREALPLTLGVTLGVIYFRVDTVLLSELGSLRAVGFYGIGYKFSDLTSAVSGAVYAMTLPLLVAAWPGERARFHRTVRQSILLLGIAALLVGVEFSAFGSEVISSLYGHRYQVVTTATGGLVAAQLMAFFTQLCFTVLVAVRRYWEYVGAALAGLVVNVGLNLYLIPRWSYRGAAAATVVTELVVMVWLGWVVVRIPGLTPLPWVPALKTVASALVAFQVGLVLRPAAPWPFGAAAAAVVYGGFLHVLQVDGPGGLWAVWGGAPGSRLRGTVERLTTASLSLRTRWLRVLVYLLMAGQAYQGLHQPLDDFEKSYWLVSYRHGFIRRGLTGSVIDLFTGRVTEREIDAAAYAVSGLVLVALVALVEWTLRRRDASSARLAVLLAASPFVVDFVAFQRRPDQLGLLVLMGLGAGLIRRPGSRVALGLAGLGLGVLVLVNEDTLLIGLPLATLLAVALADASAPGGGQVERASVGRWAGRLAWLWIPPVVALAGVAVFGRVSPASAARLRHESPIPLNGSTMFSFLTQSPRSALSLVAGQPLKSLVAMVFLGAVLMAAHWAWLRGWVGRQPGAAVVSALGPGVGGLALAGAAAAAVVLFAIGIDWLRWFCSYGAAGLVCLALVAGARPVTTTSGATRPSTVPIPWALLVAAVYLAAMWPLPFATSDHGVLRLLLLQSP